MTTTTTPTAVTEVEAAIQKHLDAHPDDHWARRDLADHLDDIGDDRAEGYRVMGLLERCPTKDRNHGWRYYTYWAHTGGNDDLNIGGVGAGWWTAYTTLLSNHPVDTRDRVVHDNCAALAWLLLPETTQARLRSIVFNPPHQPHPPNS